MSQDEVRARLGNGEVWAASDPDDGEVWHFAYGSAADVGLIVGQTFLYIFLAATVFGLLILVSKDGATVPDLNSSSGPAGQKPPERVHFFVSFDKEGKVRRVSGLTPCHDP